MITLFVAVFFGLWVGGTGPAYYDWRAERKARKDWPKAKLLLADPALMYCDVCRPDRLREVDRA